MAAAQRETILEALKTCLEGIESVSEVRRGIHFEDNMPNRPALGFTNTKAERVEGGGFSERILTVLIYGYVDIQPGDYDALDDLMQDVETKLQTPADWAYQNLTDIRDYTVYEGGAHDKLGYFDMEVTVTYFHDWASP